MIGPDNSAVPGKAPTPEEIGKARIAAALLAQGSLVHSAILIIMAGAIGLSVFATSSGMLDLRLATLAAGALLAALAALYLAYRLAFDAALFGAIARQELGLAQLDSALLKFGLMPAEKLGRSIDARIEGGIGLLRRQSLCLALAVLMLVGALVSVLMRKAGL